MPHTELCCCENAQTKYSVFTLDLATRCVKVHIARLNFRHQRQEGCPRTISMIRVIYNKLFPYTVQYFSSEKIVVQEKFLAAICVHLISTTDVIYTDNKFKPQISKKKV